MNKVGKRIYYDKISGQVIFEVNEQIHYFENLSQSIEKDIADFKILSERNRETFAVLELSYGAYAQDFAESTSYRVNVAMKKLEFSYPDSNAPSDETPIYLPPLSEKVMELEASWMYDSMMKDLAIEESNATQADLMYQLMLKGVL